jgi:hypothetical protein
MDQKTRIHPLHHSKGISQNYSRSLFNLGLANDNYNFSRILLMLALRDLWAQKSFSIQRLPIQTF